MERPHHISESFLKDLRRKFLIPRKSVVDGVFRRLTRQRIHISGWYFFFLCSCLYPARHITPHVSSHLRQRQSVMVLWSWEKKTFLSERFFGGVKNFRVTDSTSGSKRGGKRKTPPTYSVWG